MLLLLSIFFLNDMVHFTCRKTKERKFEYILIRYVLTLWPVRWHTLSIWVNDSPHWNNALERNGLCHYVQYLCGCSTSKECSIWWRTHACHIHYMHGLPIQRAKKFMILKVLDYPMLSIHHAKYNWARLFKNVLKIMQQQL